MSKNTFDKFITTKELAKKLGVDRRTIYRWHGEGKITPFFYAGDHVTAAAYWSPDTEAPKK